MPIVYPDNYELPSVCDVETLVDESFNDGWEERFIIEAESDETVVRATNGVLDMTAPKGLTVWCATPLEGNVRITYRASVVDEGGPHDRVSDLNAFWMAEDPLHEDNLFARSGKRKGEFGSYYALRLYYVGYGGNENTTTRFRRYDGAWAGWEKSKRPDVLAEYTDKAHLLEGNREYRVEIICNEHLTTYAHDGTVLFAFSDPAAYRKGHFGFRTTRAHVRIRGLVITRIKTV